MKCVFITAMVIYTITIQAVPCFYDKSSSYQCIASLTDCEVDLSQDWLNLGRLGRLISNGFGELLICILKRVVCLLFWYPLLGKESHEVVDCQISNRAGARGPWSTGHYGQVELPEGMPIGAGWRKELSSKEQILCSMLLNSFMSWVAPFDKLHPSYATHWYAAIRHDHNATQTFVWVLVNPHCPHLGGVP